MTSGPSELTHATEELNELYKQIEQRFAEYTVEGEVPAGDGGYLAFKKFGTASEWCLVYRHPVELGVPTRLLHCSRAVRVRCAAILHDLARVLRSRITEELGEVSMAQERLRRVLQGG